MPSEISIDAGRTGDSSHLGRLNDLDEFRVADGYPDIRGWDVRTTDGRRIGTVGDLIVDTTALRVRYLDVEVDQSAYQGARDAATSDAGRHTLLPIGNVQLDERVDHVRVDGYTLEQIARLPRYGGQRITRDYERALRDAQRDRVASEAGITTPGSGARAGEAGIAAGVVGTGAVEGPRAVQSVDTRAAAEYAHADYDDQRLYAPRRLTTPPTTPPTAPAPATVQHGVRDDAESGARRITLSEEQLAVAKRQVQAGEVELRKTVETRHVEHQIATTRDDVTVERRPITDASQLDTSPLAEGEIRIPVMEERLVVEKRLVPVEQIIVRKRAVTEQQTVGGELRRERLDVNDATARAAGLVSDAGTNAVAGTNRTTDR